jgi:hypothetical protein
MTGMGRILREFDAEAYHARSWEEPDVPAPALEG